MFYGMYIVQAASCHKKIFLCKKFGTSYFEIWKMMPVTSQQGTVLCSFFDLKQVAGSRIHSSMSHLKDARSFVY